MKTAAFMQTHRLDALDGLRGIAICLVAWYHLWQVSWLDPTLRFGNAALSFVFIPISGFLGVELFFFLSAFCLSYPHVRAHFAGAQMPSLGHFAYRRFIKIVPSYLLSMVAVIALAYFPGARGSWGENIDWRSAHAAFVDVVAHLTFAHTFFFDTYASINGVLWTLGIEAQYYVLFPFLIRLFLRAPLGTASAMTFSAIVYRTSIGMCCRTPLFDHNLGQLLGFLDFFAAGMLAAFAYGWLQHHEPQIAGKRRWWTLLAFVAVVWIVLLFENLTSHRWEDEFENWWLIRNGTFYAAALFALGLGSLLAVPSWRKALANRAFVFLALISYNLYLWHQVVFRWVATWPFIPHAPGVTRGDPIWSWIVTLCGCAIALAVASFVTYVVERPLLRMDPREVARHFNSGLRRVAFERQE
jgi:peptidoglycan/LPS O-acetylase OafA/YrhL